MKIGLEPVADNKAVVLILGSLPGDLSIKKKQYYANPNNHFWKIISAILHEDLPMEYQSRVEMLQNNKIALWDVLHAAYRKGSLDSNIQDEMANDLPLFLEQHPNIQLIILNGSTAYRHYKTHFPNLNIVHKMVRSSSHMPSRDCNTLQEKIIQWQETLKNSI